MLGQAFSMLLDLLYCSSVHYMLKEIERVWGTSIPTANFGEILHHRCVYIASDRPTQPSCEKEGVLHGGARS